MNMTGQHTNPWVTAAQSVAVPSPVVPDPPAPKTEHPSTDVPVTRPVFVSAHGGAGATVWASVLNGEDGGLVNEWMQHSPDHTGPVVLVLRATVDGIAAGKRAISTHGDKTFTCVLTVAPGPGRTPRLIADELKILGGAVKITHTPWVPGLILRRAAQATTADIPTKELTKITAELNKAGVPLTGETP